MANGLAYGLIIVGALLLIFNLGYLNLGILTERLSLPIVFIAAGVIELVTKMANFGELGGVLRTIMGFILVITILLNISTIFSRAILSPIPQESDFSANGSEYSCVFCDLSAKIVNNKLEVTHDKGVYVSNNSMNDYVISNLFSSGEYDFSGLVVTNGSVIIENIFGSTDALSIGVFKTINSRNIFGDTEIHTGPVNGVVVIDLNSVFGNVDVYIDADASYKITPSAAFGSINNHVGLEDSGFNTAANKVLVSGNSVFGSINIYEE